MLVTEDLSLLPPPSLKNSAKTTKQTSSKNGSKLASVGSFFKSVLTKKPPAADTSSVSSADKSENQTNSAKINNSGKSSAGANSIQNINDTISFAKNLETKYNNLHKELAALKASGLKVEGQPANNIIVEKTIERVT